LADASADSTHHKVLARDILARDAALLTETVREAGALALSLFRTELKNWTKGASSPVSEADIAVNDLIEKRLRSVTPEYGWLSEESADDEARLEKHLVWIVDPIDGTRGYLAGREDWCVSVALVDRTGFFPRGWSEAPGRAVQPVFGWYCPASPNRIARPSAVPGRGRTARCGLCGRPKPRLGPCGGQFDRAGSGW
jgi:fructose-1,6-bisphosphatase/inositol monophosphatase family enzyme